MQLYCMQLSFLCEIALKNERSDHEIFQGYRP